MNIIEDGCTLVPIPAKKPLHLLPKLTAALMGGAYVVLYIVLVVGSWWLLLNFPHLFAMAGLTAVLLTVVEKVFYEKEQ